MQICNKPIDVWKCLTIQSKRWSPESSVEDMVTPAAVMANQNLKVHVKHSPTLTFIFQGA